MIIFLWKTSLQFVCSHIDEHPGITKLLKSQSCNGQLCQAPCTQVHVWTRDRVAMKVTLQTWTTIWAFRCLSLQQESKDCGVLCMHYKYYAALDSSIPCWIVSNRRVEYFLQPWHFWNMGLIFICFYNKNVLWRTKLLPLPHKEGHWGNNRFPA